MVNTRGDGGAPTAASRSSSRTVMSLQHRLQLQQGFSTGIAAASHYSPLFSESFEISHGLLVNAEAFVGPNTCQLTAAVGTIHSSRGCGREPWLTVARLVEPKVPVLALPDETDRLNMLCQYCQYI